MKPWRIATAALLWVSAAMSPPGYAQQADSEARAVIGFGQAGGSAATADQRFFFDFFIDRKLKSDWVSLWGNVRIASLPQQIDSPVAQFATDLIADAGKLKVNQLAQTAEFATGLDFHPAALRWNVAKGVTRRLGFIFAAGASGPFVPSSGLKLFQVPDPASPQYSRFAAQFPNAVHSPYAGFIPPDRDRFYRAYGAGIRLTTMYQDPNDSTKSTRAPATYTVTIGQDENVTGGSLRGPVLKFDVFYPFPLKANGTRFLYLFGMAGLRLTRAAGTIPYILNPAPAGITGSESSVAIVVVPSNRDVYRIGVGIDAVGVVCAWKPALCQ